jgi:DNA uptake protein ComE-like DNA-binding protein
MPTDWTQVRGVSDEISAAMHYMNLNTPADVLNFATMTGGDLTAIPGIGKARAAAIVKWAEDQL